jgi:hypothetical protein
MDRTTRDGSKRPGWDDPARLSSGGMSEQDCRGVILGMADDRRSAQPPCLRRVKRGQNWRVKRGHGSRGVRTIWEVKRGQEPLLTGPGEKIGDGSFYLTHLSQFKGSGSSPLVATDCSPLKARVHC